MDLGSMVVTYAANVGQLISASSQAKSAISEVSDSAQSSGSGILGGFGKAISGAVGFASSVGQTIIGVKALAGTAIDLGSALLQPAADAERVTNSFETLLHSTSAAKQEMQALNQYAAGTPLQTQWVDGAAEKILAFGGKVGDVQPEITAIGDSLSGLGKLSEASLNSIIDIFGKISAQGKITGGDMMQLSTWGIPAWNMLSQAMHKPVPELQKMVSAGLIPAKVAIADLQQGMEKTFGGDMKKQAGSFTGIVSTMASDWNMALAAFAGPALKVAESGLNNIVGLISSPMFTSFATGVGQEIANVFSEIGGFIANNVVPAFHQLQPVAQQFISYFQSDQFAGIVADFQTVGNQIGRIAGDFQQAAGPANNLVNGALSSLPGILEGIFQAADDVIFPLGQFLIWMQGADPWAQVIKDGLIGIGVAFAAIQIGSFIATIPALVTGFLVWAGAAGTAAIATIAATWPILAVGAIIAIVVGGIILAVQHWAQISQWFGGIWKTVSGGIGGAFSAIGTKAHDATTGIGNAFSNLGTSMHDKGKDIQKTVQDIGTGAVETGKWMYAHNTYWKASVDGITAGVTNAKNWIGKEWTAATTWIGNEWLKWSNLAKVYFAFVQVVIEQKIFQIVSTITNKWTQIHNWITGKWNGLKGLAQDALNGVFFVFDSIWSRISSPLTTASNNTKSIFTNLASEAFGFGQGIIQGIINGIGSMFSALGTAAHNVVGGALGGLGFHGLPGFASGVRNFEGGLAVVGENGPEIVKLPGGSDVYSHQSSMQGGSYPIRPSATAVASSVAMQQAVQNSGGNHTTIVQFDTTEVARMVQTRTNELAMLKLGPRARVA